MSTSIPPTSKIPAPKRRIVVAYARVSSLQQSVNSLSIEGQFDAIYAFASEHRMDVIYPFVDEASAYGPGSENRPGLQAAITHAKMHGAAVVVFRVSRLSRWLDSVEILRATGVHFYSTDVGYLSEKRFRDGVCKAQNEADHKSLAQNLALLRGKKRGSTLSTEDRRRGIVNNQHRRDDNIRAAATHFHDLPGLESMTRRQLVDSLTQAGICRLRNTHDTGTQWTVEALRKQWNLILGQIELMQDDDTSSTDSAV